MHALVAASAVTAALLRYCCGVGEWVSCHYEDARTFDDMAEGTERAPDFLLHGPRRTSLRAQSYSLEWMGVGEEREGGGSRRREGPRRNIKYLLDHYLRDRIEESKECSLTKIL